MDICIASTMFFFFFPFLLLSLFVACCLLLVVVVVDVGVYSVLSLYLLSLSLHLSISPSLHLSISPSLGLSVSAPTTLPIPSQRPAREIALAEDERRREHVRDLVSKLQRLSERLLRQQSKTSAIPNAAGLSMVVSAECALAQGEVSNAIELLKKAVSRSSTSDTFMDALYLLAVIEFVRMDEPNVDRKEVLQSVAHYVDQLSVESCLLPATVGEAAKKTPWRWQIFVRSLHLRGRLHEEQGDYKAAIEDYLAVWTTLAKREPSPQVLHLVADAVVAIPHVFLLQRNWRRCTTYFRDLIIKPKAGMSSALRRIVMQEYASLLTRVYPNAAFVPFAEDIVEDRSYVPNNPIEESVLLFKLALQESDSDGMGGQIATDTSTATDVADKNTMSAYAHSMSTKLQAQRELTLAYVKSGNFASIKEQYKQSISVNLGNAALWYKLGLALMSDKQYSEAYLAFRQSLILDGSNVTALLVCSKLCLNHLSKTKEASELGHRARAALLFSGNAAGQSNSTAPRDRAGTVVRGSTKTADSKRKTNRNRVSFDGGLDRLNQDRTRAVSLLVQGESNRSAPADPQHASDVNRAPDQFKSLRSSLRRQSALSQNDALVSSSLLVQGVACGKLAYQVPSFAERKKLQRQSLALLRRAYEQCPANQAAVFHLALVYADVRDIPNAYKMVKKSLKMDRSDAYSWTLLAMLLTCKKQFSDALNACDNGLAERPNDCRLMLTKCQILAHLGDFEHAAHIYCHIVRQLFHGQMYLISQQQYLQQEQQQQRQQQQKQQQLDSSDIPVGIDHTTAKHRHSKRHFRPVVRLVGRTESGHVGNTRRSALEVVDEKQALLRATDTFSSVSDADARQGTLLTALASNPHKRNKLGTPSGLCCEVLLGLAQLYMDFAQLDPQLVSDAYDCVYKAQDIADSSYMPDIQAKLAKFCWRQQRVTEAITHYESALALDSNHVESLIGLAEIENKRPDGSLVLAHGYLASAIQIDATSHEAWYELGLVLQHQGRHDQAADHFLAALELERKAPISSYSHIARRV
jgi:tetratricopeptide (TPR) repeat protein